VAAPKGKTVETWNQQRNFIQCRGLGHIYLYLLSSIRLYGMGYINVVLTHCARNGNLKGRQCPSFCTAIYPHIPIPESADGLRQSLIRKLCNRTPHKIHSFYFCTLSNNNIEDTDLRGASEPSGNEQQVYNANHSNNSVTFMVYAWLIITDFGLDDWIYWRYCYNYTSNYNHIQQVTIGDCLRLIPFSSWTTSFFHCGWLVNFLTAD
jgi:hypothetical protein